MATDDDMPVRRTSAHFILGYQHASHHRPLLCSREEAEKSARQAAAKERQRREEYIKHLARLHARREGCTIEVAIKRVRPVVIF
jgi:hypothetical protein